MHALITAVVVIGTGNHWILDVAVGWAVVIVAMWLVDPYFLDQRRPADVRVEFGDRIAGGPRRQRPAPVAARPTSDRVQRVPAALRPRRADGQPSSCRRGG